MLELRPLLAVEPALYPPTIAAYIEESEEELFWVTTFPEGSQNAHRLRFDEVKPKGEIGREYFREGELVGYVCVPEECPILEDFRQEIAAWEAYLKNDEDRAAFEQFLSWERG